MMLTKRNDLCIVGVRYSSQTLHSILQIKQRLWGTSEGHEEDSF